MELTQEMGMEVMAETEQTEQMVGLKYQND